MLTESHYRDVFRLIPFPAVLLSVNNNSIKIVEANPAYLNLIPIQEEEIEGKDFLSLFIKENEMRNIHQLGIKIKNSLSKVLESKQTDRFKVAVKQNSLEVQHTPLIIENNELKFIFHVVKEVVAIPEQPIDAILQMEQSQVTERLLSLIISNTEEAFILLDQNLIVTSFNSQFKKLYHVYFGIDIEQGRSILTYAQPNRIEILLGLYKHVFEGNVEHSLIDVKLKDELKKIALKYSPIKDEHNEVIGVFVTAADVTELKKFEVQLKNKEQELSLIYNNLSEIVFLLSVEDDVKFKFVSINRAFTELAGLSAAQVIGFDVEEIIPEPSLSMVLRKYKLAIATKTSVSWEETSMYPGGPRTGIVTVCPIFDLEGHCIELIGSVYDITDRIAAEQGRQKANEQLDKIMNSSLDVICSMNSEGEFVTVSAAAERLWGYDSEMLIGKAYINFVYEDDRELTKKFAELVMQGYETTNFENRYLRKDGSIVPVIWSARWDKEESIMYCTAKDGTEKKNLEELLQKSNSMGKVGSWEIDVIEGTVYWSAITHEIRETAPDFVPTLETGIHYFKEGRDKETITKKVNECKANGTPWDEELQIITFKGNLKWIRTIGQAEMVNGKCIRIYGSFQDIDERRKAEIKVQEAALELEESEKRYSDLFHLSPLSMWVYDIETLKFLDVNQTALKHYGYSYDEFLSMTLEDIRPVEQLPNLEEALNALAESGEFFYEGVFLHQNKKGAHLNVEIKSNLILFKGKKAKVVVANDITERIAYFNAIEQQNKKLQEISWIQSHIVRAPLARLMGLIYLLKNKTTQIELSEKEIIEYIEHSAEELDVKIREIIEKSDYKEM